MGVASHTGRKIRDGCSAAWRARQGRGRAQPTDIAERAIDHALAHVFERASVVSEKDVLESALRFGVGKLSVDEAKAAFAADKRIVHKVVEGEKRCTTWQVRDEEKAMVGFAKETRGILDPIKTVRRMNSPIRASTRASAVPSSMSLSSRDQVTIFRGRPGTGKTTLMQEAVGAINKAGYGVVTLAPTAESSRVTLCARRDFTTANTVESFLQSEAKQKQIRGQVIWVDEAGASFRRSAMQRLFDVAKDQGCRLVLAGDPGPAQRRRTRRCHALARKARRPSCASQ